MWTAAKNSRRNQRRNKTLHLKHQWNTHIYTHVSTHTHIHIYLILCVYTYVPTHTHTHTHTQTHIYLILCPLTDFLVRREGQCGGVGDGGGGDGIFISFHGGGVRVQGSYRAHTVTIPKALPPGPQRDSISPSQNKFTDRLVQSKRTARRRRAPLVSQNQMYEPSPLPHCRPRCLRAVWLNDALAGPPLFRTFPRTLLVVRPGWTSLQPCSPSHAP